MTTTDRQRQKRIDRAKATAEMVRQTKAVNEALKTKDTTEGEVDPLDGVKD